MLRVNGTRGFIYKSRRTLQKLYILNIVVVNLQFSYISWPNINVIQLNKLAFQLHHLAKHKCQSAEQTYISATSAGRQAV